MPLLLIKLGLKEWIRFYQLICPFLSPTSSFSFSSPWDFILWMNIRLCASLLAFSPGFLLHLEYDPVSSPWRARPSVIWLRLLVPASSSLGACSVPVKLFYPWNPKPAADSGSYCYHHWKSLPITTFSDSFSILNNSEESGWVFFVQISTPIYILV